MADFRYWCFENELNYRIWHIFLCLETGEEQTIDLSIHKDIAYAHEVSWKCTLLAEGLSSLQVLQKMVKTSKFPIKFGGDTISRHEWFRVSYDLTHYRLAALRDYAFQLVNSVWELGINPFNLNLTKLTNSIQGDPELITIVNQIANSGAVFRKNRNLLAHEGIYKGIYDDPIESYKTFSLFEGKLKINPPEAMDEYFTSYDTKFNEMISEFIPEADNLNKLLNELGDCLLNEFLERFNAKSGE